jgi:hypothetical protein
MRNDKHKYCASKSISPCTAMGIEVYVKQVSVLFVNTVRTVSRQEKQLMKKFVDISAFPDLVLQGLVRVHHSDGGQDKLHLEHPVPALLKI